MSQLWQRLRSGGAGVTSVCSGHPMVLEATLRQAADDGSTALVEATCNQVNHRGGYTGMTPGDFRRLVDQVREGTGLAAERLALGGDHLGPSPWRTLPAAEAMAEAEEMVQAYVLAGYEKIHLDTSMGCRGEPEQLADDLTASRAARLAAVAEDAARRAGTSPNYVIGTEVPTPGGARHEIEQLAATEPAAVLATVEAHRRAFASAGVATAFERVMAVVAQPGVEFDHQGVVVYQPDKAAALSEVRGKLPGLVFEAHSTDYQPGPALAALVHDGFAILKVGPGLTYALRQALYGLDQIAAFLAPGRAGPSLLETMEREMLANPTYWEPYYPGDGAEQRVLRHFSYSDRIRYYWPAPGAREAVQRLFEQLGGAPVARPLLGQYLPALHARAADGSIAGRPHELAIETVRDVLRTYAAACRPGP